MGQNQSSGGAQNHDDGSGDHDLYRILGVERDATDDEIKKAYKKKALELHPDRNYGNVESSTALFAQVQSAYEVLSDPQERSWYDSHRDSLLFNANQGEGGGSFGGVKVTTADDVMRYFTKFGAQVQFSDSPTGFFGGLREIFDQLAREEAMACKWDGLEPLDYPSFGSKDDDPAMVRGFYSVWSNFATRKSFSWKDVYRYSDAPDRKVRRLMEKENKRLRDEGIREFNDAVRSLVAFAKKRDPRYKATVQSEAERQKSLREAAAAQAARSRAANEARIQDFAVPGWAHGEEELLDQEDEFTSETESDQDSFKCEVCRKYFKSSKQFEAHERSKKHIKAVKQVQRAMRNEDKEFQLDSARSSTVPTPPERLSSPESITDSSFAVEAANIDQSSQTGSLTESNTEANRLSCLDSAHDSGPPRDGEINGSKADRSDLGDQDEGAESPVNDLAEQVAETTVGEQPPSKAPGKAKQKRAKKAAQNGAGATPSLTCSNCHESFSSRTKLFNHIKEFDHAQPVLKDRSSKKPAKKR